MDDETNRRLLHAARALLRLDAATFASRLHVSVTTIRRIESGATVKTETVEKVLQGLAEIGVVVIADLRIGATDVIAGVAITEAALIGAEPYLSRHAKPGSRHQRRKKVEPVHTDPVVKNDI